MELCKLTWQFYITLILCLATQSESSGHPGGIHVNPHGGAKQASGHPGGIHNTSHGAAKQASGHPGGIHITPHGAAKQASGHPGGIHITPPGAVKHPSGHPGGFNTTPPGAVKLTSDDKHVTIDNGIMQLVLSNPSGHISAIKYHGANNLLDTYEPQLYGGYFDVAFQSLPGKEGKVEIVSTTKYTIITQKEDIVEVSFSRTWSPGAPSYQVPLNVDKRYIVRKGDSGFYAYVVVEKLKGWPDVDMNLHRMAFKPNKTLFNYMALTDEIQLVMPVEADRVAGTPLAYKEAVQLTHPVSDPKLKDQVDDKYEYTLEKKDLKLKGWISDMANLGLWFIAPSDEYMNGGPKKKELTCHCGPTCVMIFTSIHTYGLDLFTEYRNGEPWKKVFGPIFIYLNSNGDRTTLWNDAKLQLEKEKRMWPYSFVQHPDYLPAAQRGIVTGKLLVDDKYVSPTPTQASRASVGLAMPGTTDDAWQLEIKGYNFWTEADDHGNFVIRNVRPGDYNLYGYVPGVVGSFRHRQLITVKPGDNINLGRVVFTPPRSGPTLWEIGIPDRSANEFFVPDPDPKFVNTFWLNKPKDKYRQYGLWARYPELYPKEDLVFEVGVSKYEKDWYFEHVLRSDGHIFNPTIWKVVFDLPEVVPGNYAIQMALAAAQMTNTFVYINDPKAKRAHFSTGTVGTDNAIARHGNHGMYRFFNGTLPSTLFVKGRNTMFIRPAKSTTYAFAGVMYDYIRLEAPPTSGPHPVTVL